jgi:predicted outer membrane repeat protein
MTRKMLIALLWGALAVSVASADTIIPAGYVSGTWSAAGSPYLIEGEITVHTDSTLVIEPGVEVNFQGNYAFTVNGYLEAIGTEADSIHFFPADTSTGWGGISFDFDDIAGLTYPLSYCTFHHASGAILVTGVHANLIISHCDFSRNTNSAISMQPFISNPQISYCTFRDNVAGNGGAILALGFGGSAPVEITGCLFENNTASNEGGAIWCRSVNDGVLLTDCLFSGNVANVYPAYLKGGGAIFADETDFDISHCTFYLNYGLSGGAICVSNEQTGPSSFTLDHCTFWDNSCFHSGYGGALFLGTGCDASISNSIVVRNDLAIEVWQSTISELSYSDFYENEYDIYTHGGTYPANFGVLNTINANGDSCDAYFNIFMDPLFADTTNNDLHLTAGSPCIDAGDPLFALDPDSTFTEMGAFFFDQRVPDIELSATSLDFGTVTVGNSADLPLMIHNLGDADLILSDIACILSVFSTNWDPADSLISPDDSLDVTVTFTPDDSTSYEDTLSITNNCEECLVPLTGTGEIILGVKNDPSSAV